MNFMAMHTGKYDCAVPNWAALQEVHIAVRISNAACSLEQVQACFELPEAEAGAEAKAQANSGLLATNQAAARKGWTIPEG